MSPLDVLSRLWPEGGVRQFQLLYCGWLALALIRYFERHVYFYKWFYSSKLALAQKRGLGAHPCKLYGVFKAPRLTPVMLSLVGFGLIASLLASCIAFLPFLSNWLAFALSLLYFPQLYAETTTSGHSTILIPSVLFLLACAPHRASAEWPLTLIRVYVASGYAASAVCKLLCSLHFRRWWGKGSTLQMYILDGMWSRPSEVPVQQALQRLIVTSPRLATLLATCSLLFEAGFLVAPASDTLCLVWGVSGFAFHWGIYLLQGLDFTTYWAPALLAFLVGVPSREPWAALSNGWRLDGGVFFVLAVAYVCLQLLTAITLRDFWFDDVLPFSCCPMFMLPRNPYDDWPKWWTMCDSPLSPCTRASGAMEPLYWSPASPVFELSKEDAFKLPQKVVWFGGMKSCPKEIKKYIKDEFIGEEFILCANFELSDELLDGLKGFMREVSCGTLSHASDPSRMAALLGKQQRCLDMFDDAVRAVRAKEADDAAKQLFWDMTEGQRLDDHRRQKRE